MSAMNFSEDAARGVASSPRILGITWGKMEIEGLQPGKDFKLWPGGGRPWDWNETGTRHQPGIQPADVEELLRNRSRVVILSRGQQLQLQTMPETFDLLDRQGIAVHVEETTAAVKRYNELAEQRKRVGGLFHSTC